MNARELLRVLAEAARAIPDGPPPHPLLNRASDGHGGPSSFNLPEFGLRFDVTCPAVPEQYHVTELHTGRPLGYVRLRFGRLTAQRRGPAGELLYEYRWAHPANRFKGEFDNPEERATHLWWIAGVIARGVPCGGAVIDERPPRS